MEPTRRHFLLRMFERLLLVFVVVWSLGLGFWSGAQGLSETEMLAGGTILVLAFLVRWYVQHTVDGEVSVALSQSSFAYDDVFAALFDRSPVAYLIIAVDGRVKEGNAAAVQLLGTETSQLARLQFFDMVHSSERVDAEVLRAKVRAGATLNDIELPLETVDGRAVWVLLSTFSYRNSGERLVSLVDVTEQKHIDTAKSEFVALATHQLRTPIAAIRWNTELLGKSLVASATDAQDRYLEKINRNVLRMINLINDFLSVSKLEMGTYAAAPEAINLSEYFTAIYDEFAEKISEKHIDVVRTEEPAQVVVQADRRLFHIVISNLVSNAVKYLPPDGKLESSYVLRGEELTVVIADNGIGIPSGELDKLFTKFYRASNAQAHQTEGTGLGLYIVKQSVEQMGGKIEVVSDENQGARFTVVLPVRVLAAGNQ